MNTNRKISLPVNAMQWICTDGEIKFFFAINKIDVLLQKIKSKQYLSESCPEAQTM